MSKKSVMIRVHKDFDTLLREESEELELSGVSTSKLLEEELRGKRKKNKKRQWEPGF